MPGKLRQVNVPLACACVDSYCRLLSTLVDLGRRLTRDLMELVHFFLGRNVFGE